MPLLFLGSLFLAGPYCPCASLPCHMRLALVSWLTFIPVDPGGFCGIQIVRWRIICLGCYWPCCPYGHNCCPIRLACPDLTLPLSISLLTGPTMCSAFWGSRPFYIRSRWVSFIALSIRRLKPSSVLRRRHSQGAMKLPDFMPAFFSLAVASSGM